MTLSELAADLQPLGAILQPVLLPVLTWAAWAAVAEMRRRGWSTTYAEAIPRAMGAGVIAAQKQGIDPFSAAGRLLVAGEGAAYLTRFVGDEATRLAIPADSHGDRVIAQLGVVAGDAQAAVLAGAAQIAGPVAAVQQAASAISDAASAVQAMRQMTDRSGPNSPPPNAGSSAMPPIRA